MTRKYLESLGIEYKLDAVYTNKDLRNIKEIDGVEIIQDKQALEDGMNSMINTMKTFIVSYIFSKILAKKVDKIDMVTSLKGNE